MHGDTVAPQPMTHGPLAPWTLGPDYSPEYWPLDPGSYALKPWIQCIGWPLWFLDVEAPTPEIPDRGGSNRFQDKLRFSILRGARFYIHVISILQGN